MTEFDRTITTQEENSYYLNLTDNYGKKYGGRFPEHLTRLWIVTDGKRYEAQKHHRNQIWGSLKSWYEGEDVHAGDTIHIKYDFLTEETDGRVPIEVSIINRQRRFAVTPSGDVVGGVELKPEVGAQVDIQMERDLENFLANNLNLIEAELKMYVDEQGRAGRQYPTDAGTIDLLCKKQEDFVVVELKKGRSTDSVVGQISRYIGWVRENLSDGRGVRGIIVVHDFDPNLKYAVLAHENLELIYYEIQIKFISEEEIIDRSESNA